MLEENKEVLDKISEYLFEKETITGKEFMKMYRELKGIPEPEEKKEEIQEEIFVEEEDFLAVLTEMTETQKQEEKTAETLEDYFEED